MKPGIFRTKKLHIAREDDSEPLTPFENEVSGNTYAVGELRRIWKRFRHHRMAMVGMLGVLFIVGFVLLGSILLPESSSTDVNLDVQLSAPSFHHPFGTDNTGRDQLARMIYGGQISLSIGILSAIFAMLLGLLIGTLAGYFGGWLDSILMRFTEAVYVIPQLFLLILLAKIAANSMSRVTLFGRFFSPSVVTIVLVIAFTSWMMQARLIRGEVLSLRSSEFVVAAQCLGASDRRIILFHILPNLVGPATVAVTLGVAQAVLMEAYASYLGMGVQAPTPSWGNMLNRAIQYVTVAPWLWFFPGLMLSLMVMSINFLGDGLRDALDPRSRTQRS
ncbi:MAG: ABC transporter permease [Anaerolineales bacterium]|nr:ABC transporter permease [Anaerolineales bacterium]